MPEYQHDYDDDLWERWKKTVPRDKPLWKRMEELLEADADGRALEPSEEPVYQPGEPDPVDTVDTAPEPDTPDPSDVPDALEYVDFPGHQDREECVDVVLACRDYLREHGEATKADLVRDVMPDHSLGYDADDALEKIDSEGERYRGSWWRRIATPGLKTFDDVAKPSGGSSVWRWSP